MSCACVHRLGRVAALVAVLLAPLPASADWQYTRWGMTPEEAVRASGGTLSRLTPSTAELLGDAPLLLEAQGGYAAPPFKFFASLWFDRRHHGLRRVDLTFVDGEGASLAELSQALEEKYGNWHPGVIWLDQEGGCAVSYQPGELTPGLAQIIYTPLHDPGSSGL